jgi:hypothetical protein
MNRLRRRITRGAKLVLSILVGLVVALGLAGLVPSPSAMAQELPTPKLTKQATAELLEQHATRAESLEAFARTIRQGALLDAAKGLREGKSLPYTTKVELEVTIVSFEPEPWPPRSELPPKGLGIDMCWEMSSSVSSWSDCEARKLIPEIPPWLPIRTCDDIWRDLAAATSADEMRRYFYELLSSGCLVVQRPYVRPSL